MSYNSPEIRAFRGRYLQRNSFEVPDGALEVASNVTVGSDFIVVKRRGFYRYFPPATAPLNLANYEQRLIAIFGNKISYFSDTGSEPNLVGAQTDLTTETNVVVSATEKPRMVQANENLYITSDYGLLKLTSYNSKVAFAGAPSAQDLVANYKPFSNTGFLGGDKVVGYRLVFGRKDENDNLILGAPGDIATITNPAEVGVSYTHTGPSGGPWVITVTNNNHGLLSNSYITVSNATDIDADGTHKITVLNANQFTYTVTTEVSASGTLDYYSAESVILEATVPDQISSVSQGYFAQLYRSDQAAIDAGFLSTYKLVAQRDLTAFEILSNVMFFEDSLADLLRGVELYTNENTQEGESQANYLPPNSKDVTLFKGYVFYSNCNIRAFINLSVVDHTLITNGSFFNVKVKEAATTVERSYIASTGVGNQTTYSNAVAAAGPNWVVTYNGHGFSSGDTLYISNVTGGTFSNQTVSIITSTVNTFTIALTGTGTPTALWFSGKISGGYYVFKVSTTAGAAGLAETAQAIVKAINTDPASLVYARYTSDYTSVPGQFTLFAENFPEYIQVSATNGSAFNPPLPNVFGSSVQSGTTQLAHVIYISKVNEPEAVPLVNFLPVGSENQAILRIKTLRDSVIIIKEDGVFRLSGDNPQNFVVTILDSTVLCAGTDSVDVINNQVAMLSNNGVVMISESAVNIISRKIEEDIRPILGRPDNMSHGQAYESERLYMLTTTKPNDPSLSVTHVYNTLTDEWSTWDKLFTCGVVGPKDTLYFGEVTTNNILRERKSQTKIDYTDQNYATTVISVATDKKSVTIATNVIPDRGDILVLNNVIARIVKIPTVVGINTYFCVLENETDLSIGQNPILYKSIRSEIKTAPFHAGLVGRSKQFAQMQLHFRNSLCNRLTISFIGDYYYGSDEVDWVAIWQRQGWGYFPWGFEPFGQPDGIDLPQGTTPAPICRIYVPIQQQRSTFIQTLIIHSEAGENISLQAQSWSVRPYGERVSR